jgi:hypothetical protein
MPESGTPSSIADIARAALAEITAPDTVGELTSEVREDDGAITVTFAAAMLGYPGWHWTVSLAQLDGEEPSVLETELMPGDGSLLAPDWVPWSERLADWEAAQAAIAETADDADAEGDDSDDDADSESEDDDADDDDSDDDDSDDDIELDEDDLLGSDVLHGGDLDGVDIDALDSDALDSDALDSDAVDEEE